MLKNSVVLFRDKSLAEFGPQGLRLLPDGPWEPLSPDDPKDVADICDRIAEGIRRREQQAVTGWAQALVAAGAPARVESGKVVVGGFGEISVPADTKRFQRVARRLIRDKYAPSLAQLVRGVIGIEDARVTVKAIGDQVSVQVDGEVVATVRASWDSARAVWGFAVDLDVSKGYVRGDLRDENVAIALNEAVQDALRWPLEPVQLMRR
jgi:hypothetical protein